MIDYGYIVKILGSLVLVILMMVVLLYLMKRFSYKGSVIHNSVKILSALNIGPRERIMLLQVGDEQLLVGSTPSSIRPLHLLKDPVTADSIDTAGEPNMKSILATLMGQAERKKGQSVSEENSQ